MARLVRVLRDRSGFALLLVLCLFALLMAFGASLVFAAQASTGGAAASFAQEQARLSAQSVCETVRGELTGGGDSRLRDRLTALAVSNSLALDADLPQGMGTVSGSIARDRENQITVTVRAEVRGSSYTLEMVMSRVEATLPPDPAYPESEGETVVSWAFSGYRPRLPADRITEGG